jgi:hypothetical protein
MDSNKKKGRPLKEVTKKLSEALQLKVTRAELALVDRYCRAQGLERSEFLRNTIFPKLKAWERQQYQPSTQIATPPPPEAPKTPVEQRYKQNQPDTTLSDLIALDELIEHTVAKPRKTRGREKKA